MDNKQNRDDKNIDKESLSDTELSKVTGGNQPSSGSEPEPVPPNQVTNITYGGKLGPG